MKIRWHRHFAKSFKKCPVKVQRLFKKRFKLFLVDPYHPLLGNHALQGELKNYRSINIAGDYRALYKNIDEDIIIFWKVDTHSNLYE